MIEIKAGPELDRAVAEAIGWEAKESGPWERWDEPPEIRMVAVDETGHIHWMDGGPSTDLNAAFAAAERARLFHQDTDAFLCRTPYGKRGSGEEWKVWCEQDGKLRFECSHHSSTPALAICAAILKLKGDSDD